MYLDLGKDVLVDNNDIVALFDIDNTTTGQTTRKYLFDAEKKNKVIDLADDMPKSFVVCNSNGETNIYMSKFSTSTLKKRLQTPIN